MGTQKNSLNETVYEHPKHMLKTWERKCLQFYAKNVSVKSSDTSSGCPYLVVCCGKGATVVCDSVPHQSENQEKGVSSSVLVSTLC